MTFINQLLRLWTLFSLFQYLHFQKHDHRLVIFHSCIVHNTKSISCITESRCLVDTPSKPPQTDPSLVTTCSTQSFYSAASLFSSHSTILDVLSESKTYFRLLFILSKPSYLIQRDLLPIQARRQLVMGCFLRVWRNRSFCERLDGPPHLEAAHTFLITLQRAGYIWSRKFFSWLKSTNSLKAVEQIQRHKAINSCIRSICFCFSACTFWLQYRQFSLFRVQTERKSTYG